MHLTNLDTVLPEMDIDSHIRLVRFRGTSCGANCRSLRTRRIYIGTEVLSLGLLISGVWGGGKKQI